MEFEYDEAKSAANKSKHGLDFEEARDLWLDEDLLEIPARAEDEERFLVIARIAELHWSAVVTHRSGAIRLISVRRSRPEEVSLYEGE